MQQRGDYCYFTNARLSLKQQNFKLKRAISRIIMENELQTKHYEKCNLKI